MASYSIIDRQVVGVNTASVTFTNIPQTYTDLVVVGSVKQVGGAGSGRFQIGNGSVDTTAGNYTFTYLWGDGSTSGSGRVTVSNSTAGGLFSNWHNSLSAGVFEVDTVNFMDYTNTTTYKTVLTRSGASDQESELSVTTWRSTAAINTLKIYLDGAGVFVPGSSFTLYGIAASGSPKASGGAVTTDGLYWYHTFGSTGTFTPNTSITADVLVVAGGGGGGYIATGYSGRSGGGGGAGGLLGFTSQALTATPYTVTVGAGGSGGSTGDNTNGSNSQFGALTAAVGGGYGGVPGVKNGNSGGSGGGGADNNNPGTFTSGQGYAGALGYDPGSGTAYAGGGGGGAGGAGSAGASNNGGAGGVGSSSYNSWGVATKTGQLITSTYYYATGGRGGSSATGNQNGLSALANTGNGGLGTSQVANTNGMNGGSGIVIVRYPVG